MGKHESREIDLCWLLVLFLLDCLQKKTISNRKNFAVFDEMKGMKINCVENNFLSIFY